MNKVDAYKKLVIIKNAGKDVTEQMVILAKNPDYDSIPESVSKFIEDNTKTVTDKFFENLRKLYKEKNHKLYPSIMNESLSDIGKLKCLSSYLTSACIALESIDNVDEALELRKSLGLEYVSEALYKYYNGVDYNMITEALNKVRKLIKLN